MVFYAPRKCRQRRQEAKGKASLATAPDEILIKILENVDTLSILKLRLACRSLLPVCNTAIQSRLTTLYIHPSPRYLRNALEICAHPFFSQKIEEIVLLGKPMWSDLREEYPNHTSQMPEEVSPGGRFTLSSYDRLVRGPVLECNMRFRSWPSEIPPTRTVSTSVSKICDVGDAMSSLPPNYAPLVDALANLPKLKSLAFAEGVQQRGFNQVSSMTINAHAHKIAERHQHRGNVCPVEITKRKLADAEVLYGLLFNPRLLFTSLHLATELPFLEHALGRSRRVIHELDMIPRKAMAAVTNISLSFCLEIEKSTYHQWSRLLHFSRNSLERLRIAILPTTPVIDRSRVHLVLDVVGVMPFPKLKHLDIEFVGSMAPLAVSTSVKHPGRLRRPLLQFFDMSAFLISHKTTLERVRFYNVLFTSNAAFHAGVDLREALSALGEADKLESAEWIVNRYCHDPFCKKPDDQRMVNCRRDCGLYDPDGGTLSGLEMEALASPEQLDVPLDEERRVWDFGTVVGRMGQIEKESALSERAG